MCTAVHCSTSDLQQGCSVACGVPSIWKVERNTVKRTSMQGVVKHQLSHRSMTVDVLVGEFPIASDGVERVAVASSTLDEKVLALAKQALEHHTVHQEDERREAEKREVGVDAEV